MIDGTGAITSQSATKATLSKTGNGAYRLTLDNTYAEFCGATVSLIETVPTELHCHIASETVATTKQINILFSLDAAPGTGVALAASVMHWTVSLRDTARGPSVDFP